MNTGKAIFIVVGAFALGYAGTIAYRQFMLLKETDFKIQSVKKISTNVDGMWLQLDAVLVNNSDLRFTIYNQEYSIYLGDKYAGLARTGDLIQLEPKSSSPISLKIYVDFKNAVGAALNAISNINKNPLNIKGKIQVKTMGLLLNSIPINVSIPFSDILK